MGTIQQSVNNALVTGTALASLNPGLQQKAKDRAELTKLTKEKEVIAQQGKNLTNSKEYKEFSEAQNKGKELQRLSSEELANVDPEVINDIELKGKKFADLANTQASIRAENAKRIYEINPSSENAEEYYAASGNISNNRLSDESWRSGIEDLRAKRELAIKTAEYKAKNKAAQKDAFEARINSMRTSLGVDVGDLPENIRQQIIAAYGGNK